MDDRAILTAVDMDAALTAQRGARRCALQRKASIWRRRWLLILAVPALILALAVAAAVSGDGRAARTIVVFAILSGWFGIAAVHYTQLAARRQLRAEFPGEFSKDA